MVKWFCHNRPHRNIHLREIYEQFQLLKMAPEIISFTHIYRERNELTDRLSKVSSQMGLGFWHGWDISEDTLKELNPSPYRG